MWLPRDSKCNSSQLAGVSLSTVSVTHHNHGQPDKFVNKFFLIKIYKNKQLISFKSCAVLGDVMKSSCSPVSSWPGLESSLCPAHPTSYSLSTIWVIERLLGDAVFVFKSPLVFVVMAPKRKSSDADNSDMPKRQVLPLTERVKVVGLRKQKKILCWGWPGLLSMELWRRQKKNC